MSYASHHGPCTQPSKIVSAVRFQSSETLIFSCDEVRFRPHGARGNAFAEAGILVNACHPGIITSPLLKNLGYDSGPDSATQAIETE